MASEEGLRAGEPDEGVACRELLRKLEWCLYDCCPECGHYHPRHDNRFHGHFRHADDCKLARLISSPLRGDVYSCDCYVEGKTGCVGIPLYDGVPRI